MLSLSSKSIGNTINSTAETIEEFKRYFAVGILFYGKRDLKSTGQNPLLGLYCYSYNSFQISTYKDRKRVQIYLNTYQRVYATVATTLTVTTTSQLSYASRPYIQSSTRAYRLIILALNYIKYLLRSLGRIKFLSIPLSRIKFLSTPLNRFKFLFQSPIKTTLNSKTLQ